MSVAGRHVNPWLVLVLVCIGQFMVILDATIVNVALPSIQRDLQFSAADLQWVINSYTLVFGGFLLLGGRAADLVGRRLLFVAGVLLFSFASLLNGLSTSSEMLIAARGLQGLGAALVSPAALSIITTTFPEGPERTKALGVWGAIAAGGGAFGLLLGGILTESLSWEWIFFVNVPIGLAAAVISWRLIPESRGGAAPRLVRHRRRGVGDRGPDRARLRDRQGRGVRLDIRPHAGSGGGRDRPAGGVRGDRAALVGAARAARHLQGALAAGREPRDGRGRRRAVRELLLLVDLRAGGPRLRPARGRPGLPAGDRGDRDRLRPVAVHGQVDRRARDDDDRHGDRGRRPVHPRAGRGRRHLPRDAAARPDPDVDRHGPDVRAGDADRDDQRAGAGRRPRLRPVQHVAADRRRARPRRALDARGQPDTRAGSPTSTARRSHPTRRWRSSRGSRSRSWAPRC